MATSGVKSGSTIDVTSLVNSLMQVESRPLTTIQQRIDSATVSISAMAELRSKVDTVYYDIAALEDPFMLGDKTATSSDSTVATVSVTSGILASKGSVAVTVTTLAAAQRSTFSGFTSSNVAVAQSGTFAVTFSGTMSSASFFTAGSSSTTLSNSLSYTVGTRTLTELRDVINNDSNNNGRVIASIVKTGIESTANAGDDYVLMLTSTKTGANANFSASWTASSGTVRQGVGAAGVGAPSGYDVAAADAVATIGGIQVKSDSNTFTTASPGLSITALKVGSVAIQVSDNTKKTKELFAKFATDYTDLMKKLSELTKPGSASEKAGPLAGNSGVLALSSSLGSAYYGGLTIGSASAYWSDLGLEIARDRTVTFSETKFNNFLTTSNGMSMLLLGFTSTLKTTLSTYKGTAGILSSATDTIRVGVTSLEERRSETEKRLDRLRASYTAKYAALDSKLSQMNFMNQSVTSSLARLNRGD